METKTNPWAQPKWITCLADGCAYEMKKQGWTGEAEYELGSFHGDLEALEDMLDRASTTEERKAFEAAMRAALEAK